MSNRGIYLTAPDGRVIAELRYDENLRTRQRWHRAWDPHQDVKRAKADASPIFCNPNNPSKLCSS